MISDPCSLVEDTNIRDIAKEMMRRSLSQKVEHGIFIFEKKGKLMMTGIQSGDYGSVSIDMPSVLGLGLIPDGRPVATLHTHPDNKFDALASIKDISTMINGGMEFSGVIFHDENNTMIDVFVPKGHESIREIEQRVHIPESGIQRVIELNEELIKCTIDLGETHGE